MNELKRLIETPTVSGYEYRGSELIKHMFEKTGAEASVDKISNVIGVKNKNGKYKVLIDAHFDTIGLMVTEIKEGGFLRFVTVGGVDVRILPSQTVTVHGKKEIKGVIGVKPPHLLKGGADSAYKTDELFIDTGMEYEDLKNTVEIGDVITFDSELTYLAGNKIACGGLDDKLGVYVTAKVLEQVSNENIALYAVATVGEEIGLKGASVISNLEDFDLVIAIDVTHGTTPDAIKERAFDLGKGPVITLGPSLSKKYNDRIAEYAKEKGISIGFEVESGNTGTNAWAYHSARCSNPSVMVSIPLKYMHTSYEVADLNDIENAIKLVSGYLNSEFTS